MDVQIRLPESTLKQHTIETSPAKVKVIAAGRRFGKTTLFAKKAVSDLLKGKKVVEAAPVAKQTNAFWRKCKRYLNPLIEAKYVYKNESDRLLSMGEGSIQCQTAYDADTLRGDWAHTLLLDEYAYMDPSAWEVVGAPMLMDTDGEVWFAFTPNRRNHAYVLALRAQTDTTGTHAFFTGSTYDNTYLSRQAIDRLIADMSEDDIQQEIYAQFLEGKGQVFRNIDSVLIAPRFSRPVEHGGHVLVAGVDWGRSLDYTVVSIVCKTCSKEVYLDRFNEVDYHYQRQRFVTQYHRWGLYLAVVEQNAAGLPIIEQMQRERLRIIPFATTNASKASIIENMELTFERGIFQFLPDPVARLELEAFERTATKTGLSHYSAPEGMHDDTVIARALALRGAQIAPEIIRTTSDDEITQYLGKLQAQGVL